MILAYAGLAIAAIVAMQSLRRAKARYAIAAALAAVLIAGPMMFRNDATANVLCDIGIYVVLALGLNVVVGYAGLLDLGYAAFFAIGGYTYGMLASPQFGLHVPFWVLLFLAAGIAAIFGIILGAPTLRLHGDYLAIVTLGFGEIVPQVFQNLQITGRADGIDALDTPAFFGRSFGQNALPYYYVALGAIALTIVLVSNLRNSRIGRAWMAIREDELAAKHMGINTLLVKLAAFASGAAFSGLGGVIFAAKLGIVSPVDFQFQISVLIVSMLVLGGMGSVPGVIVGAIVLETINDFLLPQLSTFVHLGTVNVTQLQFLVYGCILVGVMLFKPEGLLPGRSGTRAQELHHAPPESAQT